MLVLSRREDQAIDFPNLGVSVEVLRIKGKTVRLGVRAPQQVTIMRRELGEEGGACEPQLIPADQVRHLDHQARNRLNSAVLGLHLLHRQLEAGGDADHAEKTIMKIFGELQSLEQDLENANKVLPAGGGGTLRRALLVEDDENECELLAGFLRSYDIEVATVADGADALDYLDHNARPDCVLLDMRMPRMDGPSTIQEIRTNPNHAGLKVFAVSGTEPESLGVPTGPAGVDRWFRKPLNPQVFVREISLELNGGTSAA